MTKLLSTIVLLASLAAFFPAFPSISAFANVDLTYCLKKGKTDQDVDSNRLRTLDGIRIADNYYESTDYKDTNTVQRLNYYYISPVSKVVVNGPVLDCGKNDGLVRFKEVGVSSIVQVSPLNVCYKEFKTIVDGAKISYSCNGKIANRTFTNNKAKVSSSTSRPVTNPKINPITGESVSKKTLDNGSPTIEYKAPVASTKNSIQNTNDYVCKDSLGKVINPYKNDDGSINSKTSSLIKVKTLDNPKFVYLVFGCKKDGNDTIISINVKGKFREVDGSQITIVSNTGPLKGSLK